MTTRIDLPTQVEGKTIKLIGPNLDRYNGCTIYFTDDSELVVYIGCCGELVYAANGVNDPVQLG